MLDVSLGPSGPVDNTSLMTSASASQHFQPPLEFCLFLTFCLCCCNSVLAVLSVVPLVQYIPHTAAKEHFKHVLTANNLTPKLLSLKFKLLCPMIDDIVFPFNMTEFVKNKTTVLPGILEVYVKDTRFVCDIQHTKKTFKMLCFIRKRSKPHGFPRVSGPHATVILAQRPWPFYDTFSSQTIGHLFPQVGNTTQQ